MASDPKISEGWPTLERINWVRFGDPLKRQKSICDAAEWVVRAYPALEALVERWKEETDPRQTGELASILALAKEETKG